MKAFLSATLVAIVVICIAPGAVKEVLGVSAFLLAGSLAAIALGSFWALSRPQAEEDPLLVDHRMARRPTPYAGEYR